MPRQKHLPGQKRISDFFQAAVAPTATSSSPSVKRGFVDEPAEEVVALPAVPPNKRQMLSVSSSGEGLPGRVNLDENAQVDGNATDLNDKTEVPDSDDELATPFSPTIPSTKAMTSPSTKTMTIPPTKAMNIVADKAVMKPSAKARTNLPPPPIIPDSEDEMDVEDAFMDDEYIPFEEDEQLEDVDIQVEPIVHPLQKQRIPSSELNAARYVQEYNEAHPVDEDDEDVQRFDKNFSLLTNAVCEWAEESSKSWYSQPRQHREMTMSFYNLFRRTATKPDNLVQICLSGMPRQTRKVLGRADLKAADLLDLPTVPVECRHRLAYMDIATQLPEDQLCRVANRHLSRRLYKAAKPSANLKEASKISLYVGSSTRIEGSRARMREHEDASNGYMPAGSMHYRETSKPDVLLNLRMLGVWQNPYADDSYDGQDVARWIAPMVEGLMMVYLGLYTEKNIAKSHPEIFTPSSFVLKNRIRRGIDLPDFANVSLNRAWSLCQGVRGGTKRVQVCANPECRRPREVSEDTIPGTKPCGDYKCLADEDLLSPLYCARCYRHCLKYGSMRTREGLSTGRWRHEFDLESVNKVWINQGHERKCHNVNCGVAIHPDANLYGAENGIRCYRCYKYALLYRKEYSPRKKDEEEFGFCLLCDREDVSIFTWTKVDLVKDPDLPSKLCGDCYSKRCSFLQDDIPSDSQPTTVKCCANAACWDPHRVGRLENLVENIDEHLWRCIRCDYCHEIGVDAFDKNTPPENLPKPPSGPIASHRFNCTKCVDLQCPFLDIYQLLVIALLMASVVTTREVFVSPVSCDAGGPEKPWPSGRGGGAGI
ncbi:hypothetical protein V8C43DRAFT_323325 [Trichoderma afarasin]